MNDRVDWEPRRRARRRALQALYQREIAGGSVDDIIVQFLDTQDFNGVDLEYFKTLVHGAEDDEAALVDALQPLLDRPFGQLDTMERILLLLGAWQFRHEPGTPYPVVAVARNSGRRHGLSSADISEVGAAFGRSRLLY